MKRHLSTLLAGSGLWVLSMTPAFAQPASSANSETQAQKETQTAENASDEEIVVTARRRAEKIQDVPQTVQAVTGETLEKLNLFQFEDLSKVVSGLSLSRAGNITTMRGVSVNPVSQTGDTVSFYLNEVPLQSSFAYQGMFDVGQFEVLRGPQGTLRGQSAPAGAITITTRRPDLDQWGGYASGTLTDQNGRDVQGAVNVPIVPGMLALRVAGFSDYNNGGGIESINSGDHPYTKTKAYRVSLRFEPTDNLSAVLVYQDMYLRSVSLGGSVFGNGAPGGNIARNSNYGAGFVQPVGYNGRPISIDELKSVQEFGDFSKSHQQIGTGQIDYRIAGQKLSFVGGYLKTQNPAIPSHGDTANMVVGDWPNRATDSVLKRWTQELRISSDERLFGFLDYVAGVFHQSSSTHNLGLNGPTFQPGAFGSPLSAPLAISPNLDFATVTSFDIDTKQKELSFFANATAHLGEKTEFSAGIRFINGKKDGLRVNSQTGSWQAIGRITAAGGGINNPASPLITPALCTARGGQLGRTYPGVCDVFTPGLITGTIVDKWKKTPIVWSASASHHFTRDLMVYASAGTSWRAGPTQGSIINGRNDPALNSLISLADEKSKSFEVGLKSTWFDGRVTFNADYYHQTYKNLVFTSFFPPVFYLADTVVASPTVQPINPLNYNVDAVIDGVDLEAGYRVKHFNAGAMFSWTNGRQKAGTRPCNDANNDGIPDANIFSAAQVPVSSFGPGQFVKFCAIAAGPSAIIPKWNASLRAEYDYPIRADMEVFLNGLLTYQAKNDATARSNPTTPGIYVVPSYALMDLHLGVRNPERGWEVQIFAKNIFAKDTILSRGDLPAPGSQVTSAPSVSGPFGNSGYFSISRVNPREIGVSARIAFGSR